MPIKLHVHSIHDVISKLFALTPTWYAYRTTVASMVLIKFLLLFSLPLLQGAALQSAQPASQQSCSQSTPSEATHAEAAVPAVAPSENGEEGKTQGQSKKRKAANDPCKSHATTRWCLAVRY